MQGERGFLAGIAEKFSKEAKAAAAGLGLMAASHSSEASAQEKIMKDASGEVRPVAHIQHFEGEQITIEGRTPARQTAEELAAKKALFMAKNEQPVINVKED